jgi:hypothetical protein
MCIAYARARTHGAGHVDDDQRARTLPGDRGAAANHNFGIMMTSLSRLFRHPLAPGIGIALCALAVYTRTVMPGIGFIDSGELVTVVHSLGIAHPTGYPLFTLVGWVFAHLPIGAGEAYRLNLMAAVFCAVSLVFYYKAAHGILSRLGKKVQVPTELIAAAAAGGVLFLAFSKTFWAQAVAVEVYSLHILMVAIVLVLVLEARAKESMVLWVLAAFTLGLSFTNHMTTILLVPGVLYFYGTSAGSWRGAFRGLFRLAPAFALGLSVYLYLPLRAAATPVCNWGDPSTLEHFLWHLSGKQYRVWIFSSSDVAVKHLGAFIQGLPGEFAVAGAVLAIIGIAVLLAKERQLAIGTAIMFLSCVLYAINYDIQDIDSYYVLAYVCTGLWSSAGLLVVGGWLVRSAGIPRLAAGALMIVAGVLPVAVHYRDLDESSNHLVEDYTANMFASVRPGSLVLSYQWDYWVSASYYVQEVRGEHRDVLVIDKELLRRSWYLKQLRVKVPAFMAKVATEVELFERELAKFEQGVPYDGQVIEARFVGMIRAMIVKGMEERPVYVTPEIEPEFTAGMGLVPEGLAMRVEADTAFRPSPMVEFRVRPFGRRGRLEDMIWRLYGNADLFRGDYYLRQGLAEEAKKAYIRGISMDPSSVQLRSRLSGLR